MPRDSQPKHSPCPTFAALRILSLPLTRITGCSARRCGGSPLGLCHRFTATTGRILSCVVLCAMGLPFRFYLPGGGPNRPRGLRRGCGRCCSTRDPKPRAGAMKGSIPSNCRCASKGFGDRGFHEMHGGARRGIFNLSWPAGPCSMMLALRISLAKRRCICTPHTEQGLVGRQAIDCDLPALRPEKMQPPRNVPSSAL